MRGSKKFFIILNAAAVVSVAFLLLPGQAGATHIFTTESQNVGCSGGPGSCSAQCNGSWSVSDDSKSFIGQAWRGSSVSWDDIGQIGESFSGYSEWIYRGWIGGQTKSGCNPPGSCGASNCSSGAYDGSATDQSPPGQTIFTRSSQSNVNLNFWVRGTELFGGTPYGAGAAFGYVRVFCHAGQRHDNSGQCVDITGSFTSFSYNKNASGQCVEVCPVSASWSTNSPFWSRVYIASNAKSPTLWTQQAPSGSGSITLAEIGEHDFLLRGSDGFGNESGNLDSERVSLINIFGSLTLDKSSCAAPCPVTASWSSNAVSFGRVYINGTLWVQLGPTGSATYSSGGGLTAGTYEFCLRGDRSNGSESGNIDCKTVMVTAGAAVQPKIDLTSFVSTFSYPDGVEGTADSTFNGSFGVRNVGDSGSLMDYIGAPVPAAGHVVVTAFGKPLEKYAERSVSQNLLYGFLGNVRAFLLETAEAHLFALAGSPLAGGSGVPAQSSSECVTNPSSPNCTRVGSFGGFVQSSEIKSIMTIGSNDLGDIDESCANINPATGASTCKTPLTVSHQLNYIIPPPAVDLKVKRASDSDSAYSDGPLSVTAGTAVTLRWVTTNTNASSAVISASGPGFSPTCPTGTNTCTGTQTVTVSASATFTIMVKGIPDAQPCPPNCAGDSVTVNIPSGPDFSLSASPSSQTVVPGGSTTYTVTATGVNGFSSSITLAVSGLPSGASGAFSANPIPPGGSSALTVNTNASTPAGTYVLTITGTGGGLTRTVSVTLIVAEPDFTLSITPVSRTVTPGSSTTYTVTAASLNGFSSPISLVTAAPSGAGITASVSPTTITPPSGGSATATLTVNTSASTPSTSHTITVTGTSGSKTHSAGTTLIVSSGGAGFIVLSCSNNCQFTATQGAANPSPQILFIRNSGTQTLNWTAADNAFWLALATTSGSTAPGVTSSVSVTANISGLPAGLFRAAITVGGNAVNSPQTQAVTLGLGRPGGPQAVIECNDADPKCEINPSQSIEFLNQSVP